MVRAMRVLALAARAAVACGESEVCNTEEWLQSSDAWYAGSEWAWVIGCRDRMPRPSVKRETAQIIG